MYLTAILGAITAIGTVFGVFKYWTQLAVFFGKKTLDQKNQDIASQIADEEKKVDAGGRPKWD